MADEVDESFAVLRALLFVSATLRAGLGSTSTTFRCYAPNEVPDNPVYPYVLMEFASAAEDVGGFGVRLLSKPLMLVRLVQLGSWDANCRTLNQAMDDSLQGVKNQNSGGWNISGIVRERPYRFPYRDAGGNKFNEGGGYYRLRVSKQ
jgi:hypothetical protein